MSISSLFTVTASQTFVELKWNRPRSVLAHESHGTKLGRSASFPIWNQSALIISPQARSLPIRARPSPSSHLFACRKYSDFASIDSHHGHGRGNGAFCVKARSTVGTPTCPVNFRDIKCSSNVLWTLNEFANVFRIFKELISLSLALTECSINMRWTNFKK